MKSEITKVCRTWGERIQAMREDLESGAYTWLFFKIIINRMDASKVNDYERTEILKTMESRMRNGDIAALYVLLEHLEDR